MSQLSAEQTADLAEMRADNAAAAGHYRPGPGGGWTRFAREFDETLRREGIGEVEEQYFNSRFAAFPPTHPAYYRYAVFQLYKSLRQKDRWNVFDCLRRTQDQALRDRKHILEFDGVLVSWDLMISTQHLFSIAENAPQILTGPAVLLDLGPGWGRVGHTLLRINARATYLAVDIPETILITQNYLPRTLAGVPIYDYRHHKQQPQITRAQLLAEPGVHCLGTHMLPRIEDKAVDVFLNVFSFQEMPNAYVSCYFDDADRLTKGYFYVQQASVRNYADGFVRSGDDHYPFLAHWQKMFVRPCAHVPDYFEALYRTSKA
jgi:putative sugar O-methyltransferase